MAAGRLPLALIPDPSSAFHLYRASARYALRSRAKMPLATAQCTRRQSRLYTLINMNTLAVLTRSAVLFPSY